MISEDWRANMKFSRCSSLIHSECIAVLGSGADQMSLFSRHFSAVLYMYVLVKGILYTLMFLS